MVYSVIAIEKLIDDEVCWFVRCPRCKCRWQLDECPAPGGMALNIEPCPECGTYVQIKEKLIRNRLLSNIC